MVGATTPTNAQTDPGGEAVKASIPAEKYVTSPGQVDMRTGQYIYRTTDLAFGESAGFALVREAGAYDHGVRKPFGNFAHNWFLYLAIHSDGTTSSPSYLISVNAGGRSQSFTAGYLSGSTSYASTSSYGTLQFVTQTGVDAIYTASDGAKIYFRPFSGTDCQVFLHFKCSFASKVEEPDGTVYTLSYDTASSPDGNKARLRRVSSNRGYQLIFEYAGVASRQDLVSKACVINTASIAAPASPVCPSSSQTASYSYSSSNYFMTSMNDPTGGNYTFSSDFPPSSYSGPYPFTYHVNYYKPGSTAPYLVNTHTFESRKVDLVVAQSFQGGPSIGYSWNRFSTGETDQQIIGGTYYINGSASVQVHFGRVRRPDKRWVFTSGPDSITDELGRVTTGEYCLNVSGSCVIYPVREWTLPEGDRTAFEYNSRNNVISKTIKAKPGSGLPDAVTSFTYAGATPVLWNKIASITDPKGNVTNMTYDPTHGGVLTTLGPADQNGVQPATKYSYAQRYAWIKNTSGGYSQADSPVWVLTEQRSCRSTSMNVATGTCSGGAADLVVTTYDYGPDSGPNNLWLRGEVITADGQSLRTCHGYDTYGRRISTTKPNANLSTCP